MQILIAGGSGFLGQVITKDLSEHGHEITILSRFPEKTKSLFKDNVICLPWIDFDFSSWEAALKSADVIINLVGVNIANWLWTSNYKRQMLNSRLHAGVTITKAIENATHKPGILIQASATGIYGYNREEVLTEASKPGTGFLAGLCREWENSTQRVESAGVKRIITRIGPVLGLQSGILKKMILPFKLFIGGPVGSGRQILPWIHIADLTKAIRFLIESEIPGGVYNICAPEPVAMDAFAKTLGKILHRPSIFRIPEFIIKLVFGEMGKETILASQNVSAQNLLNYGFEFKFDSLDKALQDLLVK